MNEKNGTLEDAIETVSGVKAIAELLINMDLSQDVVEFSPGSLNRIGRMLFDELEKIEKYIKSI